MKAISIKNPYANLIVLGLKPLEIRSKPTKYRGDILICASRANVYWADVHNPAKIIYSPMSDLFKNSGKAIGIATITDCRPMTIEDEAAAFCKYEPGLFAYALEDPRQITPFDVCGNVGFFNVDYSIKCCICDCTIIPNNGYYNHPSGTVCINCEEKPS